MAKFSNIAFSIAITLTRFFSFEEHAKAQAATCDSLIESLKQAGLDALSKQAKPIFWTVNTSWHDDANPYRTLYQWRSEGSISGEMICERGSLYEFSASTRIRSGVREKDEYPVNVYFMSLISFISCSVVGKPPLDCLPTVGVAYAHAEDKRNVEIDSGEEYPGGDSEFIAGNYSSYLALGAKDAEYSLRIKE